MHIKELTWKEEGLYEEFLRTRDTTTIYYSLKFRDLLIRLTLSEPEYHIILNDDKIIGVLPLFRKNGSLGEIINSLPFYGSNGGIISGNKDAGSRLLDFYMTRISGKNTAASVIIENPLDLSYDYRRLNISEIDTRIGQFTRIEGRYANIAELIAGFHSKTRNTIRKAEKSEIEVTVENFMFPFLELTHLENMEKLGGRAKPGSFFNAVQEILEAGKDYRLYVARYNGKPVSALLLLYFNKTVEYYTPVIEDEYRHLQPLSLIIAKAMIDAANEGYSWWNWGGTWESQAGVYQFKSRWNTQNLIYNYYITVNNKAVYNSSRELLQKEYPEFYVIPYEKLPE